MVVAQTLRLGQVTSLEIQPPGAGTGLDFQVVVYCDAQAAPALVTQKNGPKLVCGGFEKLPPAMARSMNICIRIFSSGEGTGEGAGAGAGEGAGEGAAWTLAEQHTITLKQLVQSTKKAPVRILAGSQTYIYDPEALRPATAYSAAAAALRQTIGKRAQGPVQTPSFDSLSTILTLQGAIDDAAMATRSASKEIDELVPGGYSLARAKLASLEAQNKKIQEYLAATLEKTALLRREAAQISREQRTADLEASAAVVVELAAEGRPPASEALAQKIRAQQARVAAILLEIFPIEIPLVPREQLTICGLPLPAMFVINHFDPVQVGAALGLVAQLVIVLSRYLEVALPYPIQPLGSQSYITNPLIRIKGSNIFPLWTDGTLLYRLEYGLYLLRQNVQLLLASREVAIVSSFQVLANLKNLMLVVSN